MFLFSALIGCTEPEPEAELNEWEIDARGLKAKMDRNAPVFILDVREPHEYDIAKIEGSTLIPLGEVAQRVDELDSTADIIVHCCIRIISWAAPSEQKTHIAHRDRWAEEGR